MPRKSLELSKSDIEAAVYDSNKLEEIRRKRPSTEDYVAEGVLDHMPEVDAEGQINTKIVGHENVVRALQMNEEANRMEAYHMDMRSESPRMRPFKEAEAERRARKFHRPRPSIIVPEMPWKKKRRKKEDA